MERNSILPILFFAIGMGLANVIYGGSLGIFLSAIIGAVCGALGVGVNELIDRFKSKSTPIAEDSVIDDQNDLEIKEENKEPYLYGFGGWLILLAIGLIVAFGSSCIYLFSNLLPLLSDDIFTLSVSQNPMWAVIIFMEIIYNLGIIIFIGLIGYYCLKQKKEFKKTVICFLVFNVVMPIVAFFVYLAVPETAESSGENLILILQSTAYAIVWILYIIKSKRVNNTFFM